MDDERPIAIVTLGAEREIWFCPNTDRTDITKLVLGNGSLCVMAPGMQDTHWHRIPKAGFECGPRISITFRGYVA
jgi:alkylated DNA repair dioxygenase AlkB